MNLCIFIYIHCSLLPKLLTRCFIEQPIHKIFFFFFTKTNYETFFFLFFFTQHTPPSSISDGLSQNQDHLAGLYLLGPTCRAEVWQVSCSFSAHRKSFISSMLATVRYMQCKSANEWQEAQVPKQISPASVRPVRTPPICPSETTLCNSDASCASGPVTLFRRVQVGLSTPEAPHIRLQAREAASSSPPCFQPELQLCVKPCCQRNLPFYQKSGFDRTFWSSSERSTQRSILWSFSEFSWMLSVFLLFSNLSSSRLFLETQTLSRMLQQNSFSMYFQLWSDLFLVNVSLLL